MSLNLHCDEVNLWQTPTEVTLECYQDGSGGWRAIKQRYINWLMERLNREFDSEQDRQDEIDIINDHIERLNSFKKLHFGIG